MEDSHGNKNSVDVELLSLNCKRKQRKDILSLEDSNKKWAQHNQRPDSCMIYIFYYFKIIISHRIYHYIMLAVVMLSKQLKLKYEVKYEIRSGRNIYC